MTFGERLVYYRERAGLKQKELAESLGITPTRLNYWEKNKREPDLQMFESICKTLHVEGDVLLGRKPEGECKDYSSCATPEEFETLIKKYRFLDPDGQETVRTVLDREVGRKQAIQEIEKLKKRAEIAESKVEIAQDIEMYPYPYLHHIACAGTGFLFDDIPTERINAPYVRDADFIIGVNGRSMEPTFSDGELLYVRKTNQLQYGDIGIFIYAGECFVKEYGRCGLISHNPEYDNISGTEDIRLIGKVVGKVPE